MEQLQGLGAVVTKDVEPYSIVAGVPAKCIKYRFSNNIIEKLENKDTKWWDWNSNEINENYDILLDVDRYLKQNQKYNV